MTQGFYRYPTVRGDRVIFVSEDDLWEVSLHGGAARRLTSGVGAVTTPVLSPDGSKVAFVATSEGAPDVYVMDSRGGPASRLTFDAERAEVIRWRDDETIVFSSHRAQALRRAGLFAIAASGGAPVSLGVGEGVWAWADANDKGRVLGRHRNELGAWKRYKGGLSGELWIDAKGNNRWTRLFEDRPEGFACPMWIGDRIWFLSDMEGYGNVYSCAPSGDALTRHTHHVGFYARHVQTDGEYIVYVVGGDLYRLRLDSGESEKIEVEYASPRTQLDRKFVDASSYLEDFDLHPDGHSLAITARGKAFNFGLWEGAVRQSGEEHGVRYRLARYLDADRVLVISDEGGEEHFEIHAMDGTSREVLELEGASLGRPIEVLVSPDGKHAAVANHGNELLLVTLATRRIARIARSDFGRLDQLDWSPDSRWIAYVAARQEKASKIMLARVEDRATFEVTDGEFLDAEPAFDPKGRYLYFISHREFNPIYGGLFFELGLLRGQCLCLVTLSEDEASPFVRVPKPLDDKGDDGDDDGDSSSGSGGDGDEKSDSSGASDSDDRDDRDSREDGDESDDVLTIDLDGITHRVISFPLGEGRYHGLSASEEGVLFLQAGLTGARSTRDAPSTLYTWNFKDRKRKRFHGDVGSYLLGSDRKTLAIWSDDSLRVVSLSNGSPDDEEDDDTPSRRTGWIDLERVSVEVSPREEWRQMLREIWRLMRDQFWREDMSGVDWEEVWERYSPLVERVGTRSEFSNVVWAMQGELGTSHAYEVGGDYRSPPSYKQGYLGIDTVWDPAVEAYKIAHIVSGDDWSHKHGSPLARPGLKVSAGDAILAVNGKRLTREVSLQRRLVNEARREVELLILAAGEEKPRAITVRTLASEKALRYREWVKTRRELVHEMSDGRVGYVHIPDMGADGYAEFHRGFATEYRKDGLVVDVRFNGGGHVSPLILEKLMRRPIGFDFSRHDAPVTYPYDGVMGPIVALTNEYAGSDGDIFSHAFKMFGLGPLLGMRTWGGVIGIWPRHELADGTVTTQPEYSFWFHDVGFGVENHGTDPDIVVENPPHADAEDDDVQLAASVEKVLELLAATTVGPPEDLGGFPNLAPPGSLPEVKDT